MSVRNDLTAFLYEGKNTRYGSFVLRTQHDRNLSWGILIAVILVSALFVGPYLKQRWKASVEDAPIPVLYDRVVSYSELSAPPPIEATTPQKPPPNVPRKQVKYVKPIVKPDEQVVDEELLPTQEEIRTSTTGLTNVAGSGDSIAYEPPTVLEDAPPTLPPPRSTEPFTVVEVMPEFPGGTSALMEYLGTEVTYPQMALDAGIEGTVYVQFVVDRNGMIKDVTIIRGVGGGCDEEALKVVRNMPRWNPGMQRGNRVPVKFVLPLKFDLK